MPESALFEARALYQKGESDRAFELLSSAGLSGDSAGRLSKALSSPVASSSVVVVVNRDSADTQHVRGFGVLEGAGEMWLLQPQGKNGDARVAFSPADAERVRSRFLAILP